MFYIVDELHLTAEQVNDMAKKEVQWLVVITVLKAQIRDVQT
jgi:hypothetical protein